MFKQVATASESRGFVAARVDATVETELAEAYGVSDYPTVQLYVNGTSIGTYTGTRMRAAVLQWVEYASSEALRSQGDHWFATHALLKALPCLRPVEAAAREAAAAKSTLSVAAASLAAEDDDTDDGLREAVVMGVGAAAGAALLSELSTGLRQAGLLADVIAVDTAVDLRKLIEVVQKSRDGNTLEQNDTGLSESADPADDAAMAVAVLGDCRMVATPLAAAHGDPAAYALQLQLAAAPLLGRLDLDGLFELFYRAPLPKVLVFGAGLAPAPPSLSRTGLLGPGLAHRRVAQGDGVLTPNERSRLTEVARAFLGRALFGYLSAPRFPTNTPVILGHKDATYPAAAIMHSDPDAPPVFYRPGAYYAEGTGRQAPDLARDPDRLAEFVQAYLDGDVPWEPRSDADSNSGFFADSVEVLTGATLVDAILDPTHVVAVAVYSPHCSTCRHIRGDWNNIADRMKDKAWVRVAAFDATNNELPPSIQAAISSYPTILFYPYSFFKTVESYTALTGP